MDQKAIVWFRNDLRIHDNEALTEALTKADSILPVYVFDIRVLSGKTSFGFPKIGKFRAKFLIESVLDLRNSLRKLGSDLIIRVGIPEEEVFLIADQIKSTWVYCNRERTQEEVDVQDNLEKRLWTIGLELRFVRGKMLYHTADLPFPVSQAPDVFAAYRKEIENIVPIRKPLETPIYIPFPDIDMDRGEVPSLKSLGIENVIEAHEENKRFIGGESEALKQLDYYFWETGQLSQYKVTRNDMFGWDFSSKLSAWLSIGCISPKYLVDKIAQYESERGKTDSTYWLYYELLWRDYLRLMGKKYGNKIFQKSGI
ncbi:MAG: deoxyribodipyrimidine photo-lyase, partial [Saprospiraceae bacterium]